MAKKRNIDWEQRRFEAACHILAGMCSNYSHQVVSICTAEDAVKRADELIKILSDESRPSLCGDLFKQEEP